MDKYLMSDTETRVLETREELEEYFSFRKKNDILGGSPDITGKKDGRVYDAECHVLGVSDAPLLNNSLRSDNHMTEDVLTDEAISEAAKDNQIMLVLPIDNKIVVYPVRYTAFPDILAAAGINGRLMYLTDKRGQYNPLDPTLKGQWLTMGLKLNEQKAHVLVRDGKIEHFKGPKYAVLPEWDGCAAVEDYLKANYPNYKYVNGMVSHELLSITYDTGDNDICDNLWATLGAYGAPCKQVKLQLRYTTSEVGNNAMRVTLVFNIDGTDVVLTNGIELRHDVGNTIDMFAKKLPDIAKFLQEAEDKVEELGNISIKHLDGCFQRISMKFSNIPQKETKEKLEELVASGRKDCTAIDVYLAFIEMAEAYLANKQDVAGYIKLSEALTKILYMDIKNYDKPYIDED